MPVSFRIGVGEFFYQLPFAFQVLDHLLNRNIVIGDSRRFPISFYSHMFKFNDQRRLMGLGAFGNGERVPEFEAIGPVLEFHETKIQMTVDSQ